MAGVVLAVIDAVFNLALDVAYTTAILGIFAGHKFISFIFWFYDLLSFIESNSIIPPYNRNYSTLKGGSAALSLYAVGDLHLSLGTDKPMDIFGGWHDYVARIRSNWERLVSDDDTVVICGDVSWAMKLENTICDFRFIEELPGKKIILKGNHDYWWNTKKKMDAFLCENGFSTISILHNNSFACGDIAICGTRGWSYDCPQSEINILLRECGRLKMSLDSARDTGLRPVVFLHYPPVYGDYRCDEIMDILHEYDITACCYGHLHGPAHHRARTGDVEGINMKLVACDYTNFMPVLISG